MQAAHQVLILDVNPLMWSIGRRTADAPSEADKLLTFRAYIDVMDIFAKSHLMLNKENTIHIIAAHPSGCTMLYPTAATQSGGDFDLYYLIRELLSNHSQPLKEHEEADLRMNHHLSQALSRALCSINRKQQHPHNGTASCKSKILVAQISLDSPSSYNAIMNSIFSAQKFGIPVDAVVFSREDSSLLQQACLLTGGVYLKPHTSQGGDGGCLQLLLTHCLPDIRSRKVLRAFVQTSVDFKASCTCHNKPVDFTFMCSVCLSLFCPVTVTGSDKCEICGTKIR
jgi:transcription initiation factor TFIIH subunit 3